MEQMPRKIPFSASEAEKCYKQAAPGNVSALGSSIGWLGIIHKPLNRALTQSNTLGNYREPPAFTGSSSGKRLGQVSLGCGLHGPKRLPSRVDRTPCPSSTP